MKGATVLLLLTTLACSTDAGGPRSLTIAVRVLPENAEPEAEPEAEVCVRLPVLLGSQVDQRTDVPAGFQIRIQANRDVAMVSFPGAFDAGSMRVVAEQVERGHADQASIVDADGGTHTGFLSTGCTPVAREPAD